MLTTLLGEANDAAPEPLDPAAGDLLFGSLRPAAGILLAVSGGPDSIAMLHLAAAWQRQSQGPQLMAVATVNHGLRLQARAEAGFVAGVAAELGLPHAILDWTGPKPSTRLMERARDARYELLVAHAERIGASHLATAHTLDDQAETILFRLARGSGPSGLIGMRETVLRGSVTHARPLLGLRKACLVATCRAQGWPFVEDPSNQDPRFARTRWRELATQLSREGLTPERLARLAERLARQERALDAMAGAAEAECRLDVAPTWRTYNGVGLARQPEEIFLRVLAIAIEAVVAAGGAHPKLRLERLESFGADLRAALADGTAFRRTLGGALVWTRSPASVSVTLEPQRRRGGLATRGK